MWWRRINLFEVLSLVSEPRAVATGSGSNFAGEKTRNAARNVRRVFEPVATARGSDTPTNMTAGCAKEML